MITTRLYLDIRQSKEGKMAPLKIVINWKRQIAYLPIGIKVLPAEWDSKSKKVKDKATQLTINRVKYDVDTALADLQKRGRLDGLSAMEIKDLLDKTLSPDREAKARFLDNMNEFASTRKKPRTREIYQATIKRIMEFDTNAEFLSFDDITFGWLDRFDTFLSKTSPKKNARNIHFRNIKAVFNNARKKKITQCYPFLDFKVRPEQTAHRDLSVDQLRTLFNAEVKPWQQKYVDFFKISFMLIGMNTEDLLHATGISGGRIEYNRAKTDKPYSIKVEPECMALIEKYRGKKYLLNILDTYSKTNHWTSKVNNELQAIAKDIGLPKISMYWARHSWSTMCSDLDIPDATNSKAMGHSPKTVTDIYINFDRNKIDRANRKVLDYVLYDKKNTHDIYELIKQLNENVSKMAQNAM